MRRWLQLGLVVLGLTAVAPASAQTVAADAPVTGPDATRIDGRVSLRDAYSTDNQTEHDVHILFLDADLRGRNLAEIAGGKLHFRLDGRFLYDVTGDEVVSSSEYSSQVVKRNERRFGETQTFADVRELKVDLEELGSVDVGLGRQWFAEAGGAWVDGAKVRLRFDDRWSTSVFGGLQPDPFDYLPTVDRQTGGAFVAYGGNTAQSSIGYTLTIFDGRLDRHWLFSRGHWSVPVGNWGKSLHASYYASVDLQGDTPVLTTGFLNASWWVSENLNFSSHYARFATVKLRDLRQQGFNADLQQQNLLGQVVNTGPYDQLRLSATQRYSHYNLYQQIDFRRRDTIDQRSATYYRAGLRDSGLFGTGVWLHGRVTLRNNFQSDSTEYLVETGYRFGEVFTLEGGAIFQTGRGVESNQSQDVYLGNLAGTLDITPDFYITLDYEGALETNILQEEDETAGDLLVHTIFARVTYRL